MKSWVDVGTVMFAPIETFSKSKKIGTLSNDTAEDL